MKSKMTIGVILIIVGVIAIMSGVFVLKSGDKTTVQQKSLTNTQPIENVATEIKATVDTHSYAAQFDSLMLAVTADGVYTNNEKKLLQEKAKEFGFNYDDYAPRIEQLIKEKEAHKETIEIDKNKEKGDEFEKYVVRKFSKKYFTVLEWAGDKYTKGVYAKTTVQPDLNVQFNFHDISVNFSVECKYRSEYFKNGIEWCKEQQLANYQNFAKEKNISVYVVIGVGGSATEANELFIIPLEKISSVFLTKDFLNQFKQEDFKMVNFFYEYKTKMLKLTKKSSS